MLCRTHSKQLTELRCRNCQLTKINPQLYNLLPQLTTLDLGRNEVRYHFSTPKGGDFYRSWWAWRWIDGGRQLSERGQQLFISNGAFAPFTVSVPRERRIPRCQTLEDHSPGRKSIVRCYRAAIPDAKESPAFRWGLPYFS